jgi:UDP-N-acetylglucosamine 1-carboxyvinyltransferase
MIQMPAINADTTINFEMKTVGGTETLMMAAVLGNGTVTLNNCAAEPEIVNVAEWLNQCGADINGVGTETIVIRGTKGKLLTPKVPYIAIPDRIEAGSYLILGALCASELTITNCRPDHLNSLIDLLKISGVPITIDSYQKSSNFSISIKGNTLPNSTFKSFNVSTKEYPGFPTDLQAQIVTYLTQVTGTSTVTENIYEGRFKYVNDLSKMGAIINMNGPREVTINGPDELIELPKNDDNSDELFAHDLRAGFAIVMAALVGKGTFTVNNAYFIDRGYEKLEERLKKLGANIRRVATNTVSVQSK